MAQKLRLVRRVLGTLGVLVVLMLVAQVIPYGRTHGNPPMTREPQWDSPRTRELAKRACFDCHSNETRWPWYADLAPFSWVVQHDVEVARDVINFSEWDGTYPLASYCGEVVHTGNMPPAKYKVAHPEADLTPAETAELWHGLDATLKTTHSF